MKLMVVLFCDVVDFFSMDFFDIFDFYIFLF